LAASPGSVRPASRIAGIEGLRAFAAGAIVVLHAFSIPAAAGVIVNSGWLTVASIPLNAGVTLFFVLSGFLLWRPFASAVASGRDLPSLSRYARNRTLRILPAYWVVLAVSALVLQSVRLVPVSAHPLSGALHDPKLLLKDGISATEGAPLRRS
jgi:peptidoglycan/LPS O-acetylase OafA/YrhL